MKLLQNAAKPSENAIFQDETPYFTILLGVAIFQRFWGLLGGPFGGPWVPLGALLGASSASFWASCGSFSASWGSFSASWGLLGLISGTC